MKINKYIYYIKTMDIKNDDIIVEKALFYYILNWVGDKYIYIYFDSKNRNIDCLMYSFDYWLSHKLFNNIIENTFEKSYIKKFLSISTHCIMYWISHNFILKNAIRNLPIGEYKPWYVMWFWILIQKNVIDFGYHEKILKKIKYKINKNTEELKKMISYIDANYTTILPLPSNSSDDSNNSIQTLNTDVLEFYNMLQLINVEQIRNSLKSIYETFMNKNLVKLSFDIHIQSEMNKYKEMKEYYDTLEHNFKTYYYRVLTPFTTKSMRLLEATYQLSWNIIGTYYKEQLPEDIQQAIEKKYIIDTIQLGMDVNNENLDNYEKTTKALTFATNNLQNWIPYLSELQITYNAYEVGVAWQEWTKFMKDFLDDTKTFIDYSVEGKRFVIFKTTSNPILPKLKKKFLEKKNENNN